MAKKWSWGSAVVTHMYYNLGTTSRDDGRLYGTHRDKMDSAHSFKEVTFFYGALANDDVGIHQRKKANVNEHGDTFVHQSEDVAEQFDASHHEHASLSPNAYDTMPTKGGSGGFDQQIIELNDQFQKLNEDK
ncbi:hypothetical protein GIB67_034227 [Kingdonia uniflora]|uniref:Uncharacterized protein n=1 Tax=Kingdonia uniflora TaxID=39325 RepID=A0A7J7NRL3_9MAGN|nr:hypothetical protein GIB67_034227 [Kingdonia uniflora]